MRDRICQEIGDSFEAVDNGPSKDNLQRELDWVLDDCIQDLQRSPGEPWEACTWRQLEPEIRSARYRGLATSTWQLRMRASVQELHVLWRQRLEERVPFQYLINAAHWSRFVLSVGPGILIPRPETEIVRDFVSQAVTLTPHLASAPWADLGTGSGAVAIAAADVLRRVNPGAVVHAVDLSPVAVQYAAYNAELAGLATHVKPCLGSWYEPLHRLQLQGELGGLLSNPPYIPRRQMVGLQAEVGRHEPHSALDGGEGDGMDSLQVICEGAAEMLRPDGFLALETAGPEQAPLVARLLQSLSEKESTAAAGTVAPAATSRACFVDVAVVDDCYGLARFVTARRSGQA